MKVENNFVIFFNSFQILKNHEILLQNFAQTAMHKLLTNGKHNKTEVRSKRKKASSHNPRRKNAKTEFPKMRGRGRSLVVREK